MHSTPPFLSRNTCRRCQTASNVARSFCDCTRPICQDCHAIQSEKFLSWEGVVDGRDMWICADCLGAREDAREEALLEAAEAEGIAKAARESALAKCASVGFTRSQWLALALEALDHAGASVELQDEIRDQLSEGKAA